MTEIKHRLLALVRTVRDLAGNVTVTPRQTALGIILASDALIATGTALIYLPAGLIVGGLSLYGLLLIDLGPNR